MIKIMKYEILRNKSTVIAILGVLVGAESVFLLGSIRSKGATMCLGLILLLLATGAAYFTVWLLGVLGFLRDLTEKNGYMMFLTPVSPYRIMFGKLLIALAELLLASGAVALLFYIDIRLLYLKYERPMDIISLVADFLGVSMGELWSAFAVAVLTAMLNTLALYSVAHLFSAVWAADQGKNSFRKGMIIVIVIITMLAYTLIAVSLPEISSSAWNPVVRGFVKKLPRYIFFAAGAVGCTCGTGYLLNRKISL